MGIYIQETIQSLKKFLNETGISFPGGIDADGTIANAYRVTGVPTHIFIDKAGKIFYARTGPMTEREISQKLEEIL